jgi:plastocyanin
MKIALQRREKLALSVALAAGIALGFGADAARAGAEIKVGMAGTAYTPKMVQARIGDVINFTNDDFENHWVYVPTHGHLVSRGNQKPGEDFKLVLGKEGNFEVLCALHTSMAMTVAVRK